MLGHVTLLGNSGTLGEDAGIEAVARGGGGGQRRRWRGADGDAAPRQRGTIK